MSAAIEFQQAVADINRERAEAEHVVFCIGLHLGDLIVEGNDLYGEGVNVAARLEDEVKASSPSPTYPPPRSEKWSSLKRRGRSFRLPHRGFLYRRPRMTSKRQGYLAHRMRRLSIPCCKIPTLGS